MPRVRAGEVQLGWREWGEGDVTVVFIHGNVSSAQFYMPTMLALPEGVRGLAIDLRGFGDSDTLPVDATRGLRDFSDDVLSVQQGSLYPALHRLEHQGWIVAQWKDTELGRSAKFYSLTREGRQQLGRELESWDRLSSAVRLLLKRA